MRMRLVSRRRVGERGERGLAHLVERRAVAEEIGLVVEQRLDHALRQRRLLAHDEDGDELVERHDPALAQQRRQRGFDPPAAAHRQLLPGARFEETSENTERTVAYLHEASSARRAMRRAILAGGRTAQASPASTTARGMPHTAELASSWAMTDPPAATSLRRAVEPVAAHAGEHDAQRARPEHARRGRQHRIDRWQAARGHALVRQAHDQAVGLACRG